ncbi:MAG TPA: DUF945 domain-containing protein [Thioalkalivibrio sp.]|nr:DUF945 domain-containing protein [Thioalkalivibrio sp.]
MSRSGQIGVYTLLGLLALVLVVMLVLPFWFGMQAQARFAEAVDQLNRQGAPVLRLQTVRYDRGWLASRAETLVHHSELPFTLKLTHDLRHGPVHLPGLLNDEPALLMAMVESRLGPGETAGGPSLLIAQGRTRIALKGDVASQWRLDEVMTAMLGSNQPVWMRADYSAATGAATVQAQLPEANVQGPDGNDIRVSDLRLRLDARPGRHGRYLVGSYSVSLRYLRTGGIADMASIEQLRLRARASERGDRLDTELAVSFEQADTPAGRLGPARLVVQLNNLDAQAVERYVDAQASLLEDIDPMADPQALTAAVMPQLIEVVPQMLSQAELRVPALYLATADGALSADATLTLPALDASFAAMPMAVLTALDLEARVAVDAPLLRGELERALRTRLARARGAEFGEGGGLLREEIDEDAAAQSRSQLSVLAGQGYLSLVNDVYRTRITMREGSLLMNGKVLNPVALMPGAGASRP